MDFQYALDITDRSQRPVVDHIRLTPRRAQFVRRCRQIRLMAEHAIASRGAYVGAEDFEQQPVALYLSACGPSLSTSTTSRPARRAAAAHWRGGWTASPRRPTATRRSLAGEPRRLELKLAVLVAPNPCWVRSSRFISSRAAEFSGQVRQIQQRRRTTRSNQSAGAHPGGAARQRRCRRPALATSRRSFCDSRGWLDRLWAAAYRLDAASTYRR